MNCPLCNKSMRKVSWSIRTNSKIGKELKEYDYTTYECMDDDVWVNTEIPTVKATASKSSK